MKRRDHQEFAIDHVAEPIDQKLLTPLPRPAIFQQRLALARKRTRGKVTRELFVGNIATGSDGTKLCLHKIIVSVSGSLWIEGLDVFTLKALEHHAWLHVELSVGVRVLVIVAAGPVKSGWIIGNTRWTIDDQSDGRTHLRGPAFGGVVIVKVAHASHDRG